MLIITNFNMLFAPLMRVFDGVTDPVLGGVVDKTDKLFPTPRNTTVISTNERASIRLPIIINGRNLPKRVLVLRAYRSRGYGRRRYDRGADG